MGGRTAGAAKGGDLRNYILVTAAYWADTVADGAARILVLFFFFQLRGTDLATVPLLDSETYHDWAARLVAGDPGWNETYGMGPL